MRANAIARSRRSSSCGRLRRRISCPTARSRGPARFSASRIWRRRCAPWWRPRRKRWPRARAAQAAIDAVRDYFYRGEIARKIDAFSKANDGLLRYEDMAAFHLEPEEPVSTTFHGYTVYKPGFWSQGPAMIETLNILEGFDGAPCRYNSAEYIHHADGSAEAGLRGSRHLLRRSEVQSDSRATCCFRKNTAAERRKLITDKASQEFLPGKINGRTGHASAAEAKWRISRSMMC